ncbi:MAG: PhzF family phenazine biosynthesis protein [Planctomycetes bacterium]|nr:PhzF family phenazine biosynthesis protein [Planctomycetota bacterium]MBI3846457.1 PhzF family phenazine biosynthesis protein [Planctomycetota bacterium]
MREIPVHRVDAFTRFPFEGNPAGVVPDATEIPENLYPVIAREMAASETAFVLRPTVDAADIRIRWFTPTTEVPLCGHATVSAFHVLSELGRMGIREPGEHSFRMECRSGILPVTVLRDATGHASVTLSLPVPQLQRVRLAASAIAEILGIAINELDLTLPPEKAGHYVVIPIRTRAALDAVRPVEEGLVRCGRQLDVHGFVLFTRETREPESDVHLRFFAPDAGVFEDPVTGSAHGPLGAYLFAHGLLNGDTPIAYRSEQGDVLGRPGRVAVSVRHERGEVTGISITGVAVTVFSGTLRLP